MKSLRLHLAALCASSLLSAAAFAADPTGLWKWTTQNRNGQPQETTLKLALAADGTVIGALADRSGSASVANASIKNDKIEFSVIRETAVGKIETVYSGKIDGDTIKGTIERPDPAPAALKANKNRKTDWTATRDPASSDPVTAKPKDNKDPKSKSGG